MLSALFTRLYLFLKTTFNCWGLLVHQFMKKWTSLFCPRILCTLHSQSLQMESSKYNKRMDMNLVLALAWMCEVQWCVQLNFNVDRLTVTILMVLVVHHEMNNVLSKLLYIRLNVKEWWRPLKTTPIPGKHVVFDTIWYCWGYIKT